MGFVDIIADGVNVHPYSVIHEITTMHNRAILLKNPIKLRLQNI